MAVSMAVVVAAASCLLWSEAYGAPASAQGSRIDQKLTTPGDGPIQATDSEWSTGHSRSYNGHGVIGRNVTVNTGETVDEVTSVLGSVTVRGHVTGNVTAVLGNVRLEPGAIVDRDVVSVGGSISRAPGVTIGGSETQVASGVLGLCGLPLGSSLIVRSVLDAAIALGKTVLMVLVMALIAAIAPSRVENLAVAVVEQTGLCALYGIVVWLLVFPVALALLCTCIGAALIIPEALLVSLGLVVGSAGVSLVVGRKLGDASGHRIADIIPAVALGRGILGLVYLLPVVGYLAGVVVGVLGLGAIVVTRFQPLAAPTSTGATVIPPAG